MSHRFGAALAILLAGAGLASGQVPNPAAVAGTAPAGPLLPYAFSNGLAAPLPGPYASPQGSSIGSPPEVDTDSPDAGSPGGHAWLTAEYLLWFFKGAPLPSNLINTGSPQAFSPGALGQPGTAALTGADANFGALSGGRLDGGLWIDPDQRLGLDVSALLTQTQTSLFRRSSDRAGNPVLAFGQVGPDGTERSLVASMPAGGSYLPAVGGVAYLATAQLWGSEGNLVSRIYADNDLRVQVGGGFRYLDLSETLQMNYTSQPQFGGAVSFVSLPALGTVNAVDSFHTRNQFYGGQLGISADRRWGNFVFSIGSWLGIGDNHESVSVAGLSSLLVGQRTFEAQGGLYALPGNIGRTTQDQLAFVPQVQVKVSYRILNNLFGFVGYDVLYWNRVVRPGDQVDTTVDERQVPVSPAYTGSAGPAGASPQAQLIHSDFWAQGLSFGLVLTY
jgi:hypothetical protein